MRDGLRFLLDGIDQERPLICPCNILDKHSGHSDYVRYMLDRTARMFTYEGLPDTIPGYMLELMLQCYGAVVFGRHGEDLFVFRAEQGGPPDVYYRPTQAMVANPALPVSIIYRIANYLPPLSKTQWENMPEGVVMKNDTQEIGLLPLFSRYATQMVENDISIRCAQINLRIQHIISASDGPEIESANKFIRDLEVGKLSAIAERAFLEGVNVTESGSGGNPVMQLLELQQYLRASWYNEIGLNSNFNMKSQYLSENELNSSADAMLPLVDDMLECRQRALDIVNQIFGTSITVRKDSAWAVKEMEAQIAVSNGGDMTESEDIMQNGAEAAVMDDTQLIFDTMSFPADETIDQQELPETVLESIIGALEAVEGIVSDIAEIVTDKPEAASQEEGENN